MKIKTRTVKIAAPLNSDSTPSLQWIETASSLQIPSFHIVGLPSQEVSESRERVKAAIESSGLEFPRRRVVINLSPANIKKQGTSLDLGIALSVLIASFSSSSQEPHLMVASGELGLDGTVKNTGQITRTLYATLHSGIEFLFLPTDEVENARQAIELIRKSGENFFIKPPLLIPVSTLSEAWKILVEFQSGKSIQIQKKIPNHQKEQEITTQPTYSLLPLTPSLERVLGIVTAGDHHLFILGPRGTGKSHALEWLIALQQPPHPKIKLQQILLAELNLHKQEKTSLLDAPIRRRVGVQARPAALIGNASSTQIRPGEFSLAHGGLLIADELPEWARDSREALREPLERGLITLTRTHGSFEMPAQFTLVANGNYCPCGGWPSELPISKEELKTKKISLCNCSFKIKKQYLSKLSGPILDRIDLVLKLSGIPHGETQPLTNDSILKLKSKILETRHRLIKKWGAVSGQLSATALEEIFISFPVLHSEKVILETTSYRSRHKILKIALTLAAWDGQDFPSSSHLREAAYYRPEMSGLSM